MSVIPLTTFGRRSILAVTNGSIRLHQNGKYLTVNSDKSEPSSPEGDSAVATPPPKHVLSPYERFVVRVTRSYSGSEVPTTMGPEAMDRVNSRFRIGLMAVMMTFTLGVSLLAIRQGRREKAAHSSEMVYSKNRSRYK